MKLTRRLAILLGIMILGLQMPVSAETWKDLLDRADSLASARNQDSAIVIGRLALEETKAEFGGNDTATARVFNRLAVCYFYKGAYDQADTLYHGALAIWERVLGPDHPSVANGLSNISLVYYCQARYSEAEQCDMRALAIREKAFGPDHPDVATSLTALASLYVEQARYADAELYYKRALAIREKAFGPENKDVAASLNNLATAYFRETRFAEAEPLFRRSLAICEKILSPDHPYIPKLLSNLAGIYNELRRYAEAEQAFKKVLAIQERAVGPDHPDVATSLFNLANVYTRQERDADAIPLYKRALEIREKALGPDHPDVATTLSCLAMADYYLARYSDAEPLLKRALQIRENTLGPNHPDVALSLNDLAMLYTYQGRYADAESLYQRALGIEEKASGPDNRDVAYFRESYSTHYRVTGQLGPGIAEAAKAFNIRLKNFRDNAYILSEMDALPYSTEIRNDCGSYLSCLLDNGMSAPEYLGQAGNIVLESKGIVSEGIMQRQQALVTEKDSTTLALAESLRSARLQISQLYSEGPGDDTTGLYRSEVDSLARIANDLEAELSRHSASFQRRQDVNNISVARIDSVLPSSTSLVEYLTWDYHQLRPDSLIPRYLALVIDKGKGPKIINLGDASEIEPLVGRYLKHMQGIASGGRQPNAADMLEYRSLSQSIYEKVWKPLENHLRKGQRVFVALDGSLNLVSIAGLMDEKGTYVTEKYILHHLSSGRDLIRLKDQGVEGHGLLAIGDPDFDASIDARMNKTSEPLLAAALTSDTEYQTRNVRSGCGSLSDLKVESLPFTRNEVQEVGLLWQGKGKDSVQLFVGAQATEDAFKTQAPGKRVIHLATHGYYLTGQCASPLEARRGLGSDQEFVGENPLLQSGLLLAGSNLHGAGCDSAHCEDGILSASEVAGMDLSGTDLVVLSACETGLGEVKSGEGVYGLRRAFQMAGARTVISSLWPVPDQATADVMSQLYGLSNKPIPERLRDLQLAQIKKLRAAGSPDHPFSWGAFIALGDWR